VLFLEKSKSGISMKKGKISHLGAGECHEGSLGDVCNIVGYDDAESSAAAHDVQHCMHGSTLIR